MSVALDLASPDAAQRLRAVERIAERGTVVPSELPGLAGLLGDPDKRVQRRAGEVLAETKGDGIALAAMLARSLAAESAAVRWGAAFCQARAGQTSPAACAVWIDHLGSGDRDIRWAAHQLLVEYAPRLGEVAMAALHAAAADGDPQRRKMALYSLRDLGVASAANATLAAAALAAPDIGVRLAALAAYPVLAGDTQDAARVLCRYLDDGDPRMRRATAAALGRLPRTDVAAREALQVAAQSRDSGLSRAARAALDALRSTANP